MFTTILFAVLQQKFTVGLREPALFQHLHTAALVLAVYQTHRDAACTGTQQRKQHQYHVVVESCSRRTSTDITQRNTSVTWQTEYMQ